MKKHLFIFALALCSTTVSSAQTQNNAPATECKPLTIRFLGFADHNGNRIGGTDLRDALECVNDKKTVDQYKAGNAMNWIGTGLVTVGSILLFASTIGTDPLNGPSDDQTELGIWGLKTMGAGLGVQLGGLFLKKGAVRRYNRLASGAMPAEAFTSPAANVQKPQDKRVGFAFGKTFYKRGVDVPDDVYLDGLVLDDNSEIANSGFYLNFFAENKIAERFQGRAEFNWTQRGFGLSMNGENGYWEARTKSRALTNYLEVAWLGQFIANTSKPGILLSVGPGLGFLTSIKIKAKATVRDIQTGDSETVSESVKGDLEGYSFGDRLDYGLHFGAGARWPIGDSQLCLDIRYFLGLKNVNDDPESPEKEFNRGWSLGLGYAMPF